MSEQGKQGFRINTTIDIGHIVSILLLMGGLFAIYRGDGERKVAQESRITAVEKESRESRDSIVKITDTIKVISENQVRLAEKFDAQERRFSDDHDRIRSLEKQR